MSEGRSNLVPADPKYYKYTEHYNDVLRGRMPNPVMLLMYLIQGRCNHHCHYCQIEDMEVPVLRMPTRVALRTLEEARSLGCRSFEVCGLDSEPMLHPGVKEIYTRAAELGYICSLLTNGSIMDQEMAGLIADHFDYIRFSVDSFDEDTFNKIREPNPNTGVEVIKKNIQMVVDAVAASDRTVKCTVGIKACLTPDNNNPIQVAEFIADAADLGPDSISFKRAIHSDYEHPDYTEVSEVVTEMDTHYRDIDIYFKEEDSPELKNTCLVSSYHLFVDVNGDVPLCCYHWGKNGHIFGNVNAAPLSGIWGSEKHWDALRGTKLHECDQYECKAIPINNFMHDQIVGNEGHLDFFG